MGVLAQQLGVKCYSYFLWCSRANSGHMLPYS